MRFAVALAVLVTSCRGDAPTGADPRGSASAVSAPASLVPALPSTPSAAEELASLDANVAQWKDSPELSVRYLLQRAAVRGRLEDYVDALARSQAWIEQAPNDPAAWKTRVTALTRVHRFDRAREALAHVREPSEAEPLAAAIAQASTLDPGGVAYRERVATQYPDATSLTMWAATLATAGRYPEALAIMPRAVAGLRGATAEFTAWLLFQWGRIYEQQGELATARDFYAAARARLPTLEATVHWAQATLATGGDPRAEIRAALAGDPNPELYALAGDVEAAKRAWERYLAALPEAFSEHAARFYLGVGRDPARALLLARQNRANRETYESIALVIEAALAADQPETACGDVGGWLGAKVPRPVLFVAWKALSACKRTDDADRVATWLGIR